MTRPPRPTVHRGPGQSYWDRVREIEAILTRRSTVTPEKRAEIGRWLASSPLSAKHRPH